MKTLGRWMRWYVLGLVALWILPHCFFETVGPHEIGVRQSNFSGVGEDDLDAGWALRVPGMHKIIHLPSTYEYLDYSNDESGQHHQQLQIRTKDNNTVYIDVAVPYRIKPGEGWQVVQTGNHQQDPDGRFRFQRLAEDTTVSVLREHLAELSSPDFYSTERRLGVAATALTLLNEKLAPLHLEAERVLVRAITFRAEYEQQLQQIQLNEQKKLLDEAAEIVAREQQKLDNYAQATNAMASSLEQKWIERRARIERAYEVGFLVSKGDMTPGAARRILEGLDEAGRKKLTEEAVQQLGLTAVDGEVDGAYLLGIRNIEAETLEYDKRVRTEADGVAARLQAEGDAMVATVRGDFDARINALLGSAAGRAYVAWKSAENVKFAERLTFSSSDGVPIVLRLRALTEAFMGQR